MRFIFTILILALILTDSVFAASASSRISVHPKSAAPPSSETAPSTIFISKPLIQVKKMVTRDASVTVSGKATAVSGVAAVTVNEQPAALDKNGNFSTELLLKPGQNQVNVVATDVNKETFSYRFIVIRE